MVRNSAGETVGQLVGLVRTRVILSSSEKGKRICATIDSTIQHAEDLYPKPDLASYDGVVFTAAKAVDVSVGKKTMCGTVSSGGNYYPAYLIPCSFYDLCGICNGDDTTCAGCDGKPNSGLVLDACEVCGGDGSTCAGCDGKPNSGLVVDVCGVCGGDNSACNGCDGKPNSGLELDACGVCAGDGSTCAGCDGVPNSGLVLDACTICGGDDSTCAGCDGIPNSGLSTDACGTCGGDGLECACCPGMMGVACDVEDYCYKTDCGDQGTCDVLSGLCVCELGHTGQYCELSTCSENGVYKDEACLCFKGWDGADCATCKESPGDSKTYLCLPSDNGYMHMAVPNDRVSDWLDGAIGSAVRLGYPAIRPNTNGYDGLFRDCRCQVLTEDPKRSLMQINNLKHAREAKRWIETELRNPHLKEIFNTMLINKYDGERAGGTEQRLERALQQRDHTDQFFTDLLETILSEIALTQDEEEATSFFFEECLEEHHTHNSNGFFIVLPLAIIFAAITVLLFFIIISMGSTIRTLTQRLEGGLHRKRHGL